jgi:hypothetical protein
MTAIEIPDINVAESGRRVKRLAVPPAVILGLFKNHEPLTLSFSGLPSDARIVFTQYQADIDVIVLTVESESFPPVRSGVTPEYISVNVRRYYTERAMGLCPA